MMTKGVFKSFHELGSIFGKTEIFDRNVIHCLAKGETFSLPAKLLLTVLGAIGLTNSGWNMKLKKNGAYEKRYDQPYL